MCRMPLRVPVRSLSKLTGALALGLALGACAVAHERPQSDATISGDTDGAVVASDGDGGQLQAPETFDEYCGQFARLWCQGHLNCCDLAEDRHASVEECEEGFDRECRLYFLGPVYGSCVRYDKGVAQAHLAKLAAMVPSCTAGSFPWYGEIFNGTTPPEGACSYTLGDFYTPWLCCQSGTSCVPQKVDGLQITAQCKPGLKQVGESCADGACADGLYCAYDAATAQGYCLKEKPLGAACTNAFECSTQFCEEGTCGTMDAQTLYCGKAMACAMATGYYGYTRCEYSWRCDGEQQLKLACDQEGTAWKCACEQDTVQVKTFNSSSICNRTGKEFYAAVSTGCGWPQLKP